MLTLTSIESNVLNLIDALLKVGGQAVAENNPDLKTAITGITSLADTLNQSFNPTAAAAETQINQVASDVQAGLVPVVAAVATVKASDTTLTQKVDAGTSLLGIFKTIEGDVVSLFSHSAS